MSGYTLTWNHAAPLAPGDGSFLRPDTLGVLAPAALGALPVAIGRTTVPLGDLFVIEGEPGPELNLRGLPPWDRLGAGLASGELVIHGDAGNDLGAAMHGGRIHVHGSAGHRIGGPDYTSDRGMTAGEIVIDANAGDFAGLRMRRGLIAIRGSAGASPGYRMIAGTVAVGRGPLDAPGLEMRRGTVLLLENPGNWEFGIGDLGFGPGGSRVGGASDGVLSDNCGEAAGSSAKSQIPNPKSQILPAHLMPVGTFDATVSPILPLLIRRLTELGWAVDPGAATGRYLLGAGDRFELGKGEVWQWVS